MTIWAYQGREPPLTDETLGELYGFDPSHTAKLLDELLAKGLIGRREIRRRSETEVVYALSLDQALDRKASEGGASALMLEYLSS